MDDGARVSLSSDSTFYLGAFQNINVRLKRAKRTLKQKYMDTFVPKLAPVLLS